MPSTVILSAKPYVFKLWEDIGLIDVMKDRNRIHTIVLTHSPINLTLAKSKCAEYLASALLADYKREKEQS